MQLQYHLLQLVIILLRRPVAPGGRAQRADSAGGGEIGDGTGRARAHHFAPASLGEGQQRVMYLLHGLLVIARRAGRRAGVHADLVSRLLAHAGPLAPEITRSHDPSPGRAIRHRAPCYTMRSDDMAEEFFASMGANTEKRT